MAEAFKLRGGMAGNGRREALGDGGDVVIGDVVLDPPAQGLEEGVDAVDLCLELEAEADAATRLLPLQVDTCPVVTGTPGARRLGAVTLDLARLAEFTTEGRC